MVKVHVKRDDIVTVISGAAKGKTGKVMSVDRARSRVVVEGVNVRKKTVRRSQEHPQGGIIEIECPIHSSNVMLQEKYDARRANLAEAADEPAAATAAKRGRKKKTAEAAKEAEEPQGDAGAKAEDAKQ
jgi:large subunit ribosomal protein L24